MFYEIRTYRIKTGAVPAYLKLVEEEGIELQKRYLGQLVGYFVSEIGPLNQIVHIWAYTSLDDRVERRDRMAADIRWQEFGRKVKALDILVSMESRLMRPTEFSPLK